MRSSTASGDSMTILDALAKKFPDASRSTLRKMLADRRITVAGVVIISAKHEVENESIIVIARKNSSAKSESISGQLPFEIIHQDSSLIIINKPAGLLTSSVPREKRPTALGILRQHFKGKVERVGLVHRLDMDASGLLVFSANQEAHHHLKKQFAEKSVERIYHAIVDKPVLEGVGKIESFLVELVDGSVRSTLDRKQGKRAITHFKVVKRSGQFTLLEVKLETGRKHQIRAHLLERCWPIVGDPLYHPNRLLNKNRLMLAATKLGLVHPKTNKQMFWTIDLPDEFEAMLKSKVSST